MTPSIDQYVVLHFRQGIKLEGTVISWSDTTSVIKSNVGAKKLVIQKTKDDILFYEIIEAKTEYEKLKEKPRKTQEDLKTLAELKIDINDIERSEIREKLTTHEISGIQASYGIPRFAAVQSAIKHPREEAPRKDIGFGSSLSNLFGQENKDD